MATTSESMMVCRELYELAPPTPKVLPDLIASSARDLPISTTW